MKPLFLFLVLFPATLIAWFVFARPWVKAHVPVLAPMFEADEAFYEWAFNGSRTLVISRGTAFLGYMLTLLDLVVPLLDSLTGAGVNVGELVGLPSLGPILVVLGHVLTYVRQTQKED